MASNVAGGWHAADRALSAMQNGAGSSDHRDALGGDLYATILAALRFQVRPRHYFLWVAL